MARLSDLPSELVRIVAKSEGESDAEHDTATPESRVLGSSDLASFARISRRFYDIINPVLYAFNRDFKQSSAVSYAAKRDQISTLDLASQFNLDLDSATEHLEQYLEHWGPKSPLYLACEAGHDDTVNWFLVHGSRIDTPCLVIFPRPAYCYSAPLARGWVDISRTRDNHDLWFEHTTALHEAAARGLARVVEYIVRNLVLSVDATNGQDETPLHVAVKEDSNYRVIRTLIELGADINAEVDGTLPINTALEHGQYRYANQLHDAGAIVTPTHPQQSNHPIHACVIARHRTIGYTRGGGISQQNDLLQRILAAGANVDERRDDGLTPLSYAAYDGTVDMVLRLIAAGADVHLRSSGITPLCSLMSTAEDTDERIAKMVILVQAGARMDEAIHGAGAGDDSLLEWAADLCDETHDDDPLERLLLLAESVPLRDGYIDYLLDRSFDLRQPRACRVLLTHGATLRDAGKASVWAYQSIVPTRKPSSICHDRDPSFDFLLDFGFSLTQLSSLLTYALESKDYIRTRTLLQGAALQDSPMHLEWLYSAVQWGEISTVERLLGGDIDVNSRPGDHCMSLLSFTTMFRHTSVIRLLVDHGADPFPYYGRSIGPECIEEGGLLESASPSKIAVHRGKHLDLIKAMWEQKRVHLRPDAKAYIPCVRPQYPQVVQWLELQASEQQKAKHLAPDMSALG
ncbi:Uu.00g042570.m01.CDS01 [Anthostomella pinea]|uniref:Uu.00g042570.m01.CDS01 n=1 Tax=Anthostomella pinea TaxID=933095 RepID=A0AAI8YBR0_9PEZI|nr:Uu.00g042570.m01.CDS01 [Anthostomella pinea]